MAAKGEVEWSVQHISLCFADVARRSLRICCTVWYKAVVKVNQTQELSEFAWRLMLWKGLDSVYLVCQGTDPVLGNMMAQEIQLRGSQHTLLQVDPESMLIEALEHFS